MKIKLLLIIYILCFITTSVFAENHYINAACSSACDGSTWARGWKSFGAVTWIRGDTYYVAGGTYAENVTIPAKTGTDWITIKKANATDNSGDTGWDASFATIQAVINGSFTISSSYVEINGVTGSGTSGHGIKVSNSPIYATLLLASNTTSHYLRHIEVQGIGFLTNSSASGLYNGSSNTTKNLHISYCWIHDTPGNGVTFGYMVGTDYTSDYGLLFENNVVSETGGGYLLDAGKHAQGMQIYSGTNAYTVIRNNIFRNNVSQGAISFLGNTTHTYTQIYNNLFYITDLTTYPSTACSIYWHISSANVDNIHVYNNTFYNLGSNGGTTESTNCTASKVPYSCCTGSGTGCRAQGFLRQDFVTATNVVYKNNIWMNSRFTKANCGSTIESNEGGYLNFGTGYPTQTEGGDPFVDTVNGNFHLKAGANAIRNGEDLSSVFTTDIVGTARPQGSAWDIGAYQYQEDTPIDPPPPPQPPLAPGNLSATASSISQINLSWTDNSNDETGFIIESCTDSSCTDSWLIDILAANVKTYSDTGLAADTTYYYRVRAYNSAGNSGYSNTADARTISASSPPAAPSNLTATASSSRQLNLSWTDNSNNETGFKIERCTGYSCSSFTQIASVAANVRTYINTGLYRNATYTYRVRSYNSDGSSGYSNTASARAPR